MLERTDEKANLFPEPFTFIVAYRTVFFHQVE